MTILYWISLPLHPQHDLSFPILQKTDMEAAVYKWAAAFLN